MLLAMLCGVLLALAQAPINFPYAAIIAIPLLLVLTRRATNWRAGFSIGWATGVGYFTLSLSWIVEPFLVNISRHGWMAPFAIVIMASGLALFWGLGFSLARRWMRGNAWDALVLAGFWTMVEVLRSHIFTGFPWALLAYGWVDTPVIQGVALIGVHGLGFAIMLTAGLIINRRGLLVALVLAAGLTGYGSWRLTEQVEMTDLSVRLVQPNAAQHLKWHPDHFEGFYRTQLDLSAQGRARPDVIIWPEVSIVYLPDEQPVVRAQIADAAQAPVILGARRRDLDGNLYNSVFLLSVAGDIEGVYDKHHLTPFGEYIPLQGLVRKWGLTGLAAQMGGLTAGDGPHVLEGANLPPFLPLVCYEAIFPQGLFADTRPDWLVQVTNDAWFGKWNGPYQHLAQARVRAIEQGLPLARAANTGVSAMIGPYGRVTASITLGQAGYVDAPLPAPLSPTVFALTGQWPAIFLIAVLLGLRIWGISRRANR